MKYITATKFMSQYQITKQTLYQWRKTGKVDFIKQGKQSYLYNPNIKAENQNTRYSIGYARVSNTKQADDLARQANEISDFMKATGTPAMVITDIGSGMNENRKNFNKLIDLITSNEIDTVYITYKDRLTRFNFELLENLFNKYQTKIIVINQTENTPFQEELTRDLISIIHHFSMKLYSNRRKLMKEINRHIDATKV